MFHVYPLDPIPDTRWDFVAFVVLGTLGLSLQLRTQGRRKKKMIVSLELRSSRFAIRAES